MSCMGHVCLMSNHRHSFGRLLEFEAWLFLGEAAAGDHFLAPVAASAWSGWWPPAGGGMAMVSGGPQRTGWPQPPPLLDKHRELESGRTPKGTRSRNIQQTPMDLHGTAAS